MMPTFDTRYAAVKDQLALDRSPAGRLARVAPSVEQATAAAIPQPEPTGITYNGQPYTPDMNRAQGYGFTGTEATADQVAAYQQKQDNTPAAEPWTPAPITLPGAHYAQARATGSPGVAPGGFGALPFAARQQMLAKQFGLDGRGARALTNNLYLHPENTSAVMAGTNFDPLKREHEAAQLDATRASTALTLTNPNFDPNYRALAVPRSQADLEATRTNTAHSNQTMGITAAEAARRAAGDAAAATYFSAGDDEVLKKAIAGGASAETLIQLGHLADQRRQRDQAAPREAVFNGRPAVVSNNNVQFTDPPDKGIYSEGPKITRDAAGNHWAQSGPNQPWTHVTDPNALAVALGAIAAGRKVPAPAAAAAGGVVAPPAAARPPVPAKPSAASPFAAHEGKVLNGPDGKSYRIVNGKPELVK